MQIVPQAFHDMAQNSVIPVEWDFRVSFTKAFDDDVTFFVLDTSVLDGVDVLAPVGDNPIQQWDKYEYADYDDRVIDMVWTRKIDFPYSVQSATADINLNNYDNYFTPNSTSPIEQYVIPKRPIRILTGFKGIATIPQFVGLTQGMPELDQNNKTASFYALDFLSEMFSMKLTDTIAMADVTTDEVLDVIFQQFGLSPSQYSLATGRNRIPFLFFERGLTAGEAFRRLMQSEMGKLWLDEEGILRFEQRLLPNETSVMTFDSANIVDIKTSGDDEIINTVRITSTLRQVKEFQVIFSNTRPDTEPFTFSDASFVVPANSTAFYPNANLDDPALSATAPTLGFASDTSWFTAKTKTGVDVTSDISITLTSLNTSSYTMLFENDNAFDVVIDEIEVWGEPARVVNTINYEAYDEDSVTKYGELVLEVENDFFGSYDNCDAFAEYVLDGYKEYAGVIELEVKGDPSLQLGDVITVDYDTYNGEYKVIETSTPLRLGDFTQTIKARRYTPKDWFILDESVLDGADILAP